MNKVYDSAAQASSDISDSSTLMVGGFGLCGIPENLITAIAEHGITNLTVISNNCGIDDKGLGILLAANQIQKMISSYVGENKVFEKKFLDGDIDVELLPQGTLAEKIRAGGSGIPAFFTPTGYGTSVAEGKETRMFNDRHYVLETSLTADFAIVKAWKADTLGNLVYRKTARNFNPIMAMAGKVTIVEAEEIVKAGELDPDEIHTPGIFVQRVLHGKSYEKPIEILTLNKRN